MVVAAWIIFTAFSLGCGLSTSLEQLIAFRALQGVGGSGLYSLCNVRTYMPSCRRIGTGHADETPQ